jgi:hypothetical protein
VHYQDLITSYFDDLRGIGREEADDLRPIYSIDFKDEKALIKWLDTTITTLQAEASGRTKNQFKNLMFYKGIHSLDDNVDIMAVDYDNTPISDENRFVMNHILEFTIQKQSRLMRFSPTINVFPYNNSYRDRLGARLGKKIIDSNFHAQDVDSLLAEWVLEAAICGEAYLFPEWDEFAGDKSKEVERAEKLGGNSFEFVTDDGEKINLTEIPRIGDHKTEHPLPFYVLHEPKSKWKDVNYLFKGTPKHIDEIRAENKGKITDEVLEEASFDALTGKHVLQWEFYHKKTRFVPNGLYAKFVGKKLLATKELPYDEIPVVRFTDYDDPLNAHGRSFYEALKLPSVMINNLMKIAYRSYCLAAYPKIIMQTGSTNMYSMANGPFVIEHDPGSTVPQIVSFNAVNNDFFQLSNHVEQFMEKNSGTFGVSRGQPIANARARSILNFYTEQEQERESTQIRKFSAGIEKLAKFYLSHSAKFYKADDGRTLKIVGKNNQYKLLKMTEEVRLSSNYNVKVQRTTALSESKQGRIDQIQALSNIPLAGEDETTPGLFTREQVLSMIEVADIDSFFEMASAASEAASSENEDMFEGGEVPAPAEYQAHLVHWNQHFLFIQSREFTDTDGIPEDVKKRILEHLQTHEYFMYKAARVNLELATILSRNKYFPCVFKLAPTDLPLSQVVIMLSNPPAPMPPPNQPPIPDGSGQEMEAQILNELGDTPLPDEMGIPDNMEEGEPNIAMEGESINVG